MFNVLRTQWLPVRLISGGARRVRPAEIGDEAILAIDWPRPDFRIATLEFLIGLMATAFAPRGSREWLRLWNAAPDAATLDEAFEPIAHAFDLDGDGPRFLQDREDLVADAEPIERLLIESPGASTLRNNTDLMVRRGRVAALGRPAAAIALYTFQAWAPAGGAGNRTGLRGGGPLTTLVVPEGTPSLWRQIWANVPIIPDAWDETDLPRIFPWLTRTVTSEGGRSVTPQTAHPLQCWWGMPRRIRLDFERSDQARPCDLTGEADTVRAVSWRQRPRGPNYAGWGRIHPLSPHYRQKGGDWLPLHPQPGGIGYRHWLGLVVADADATRVPADAVTVWRQDRERDAGGERARLLAAGYDMDNMKARAFMECEMPLPAALEDAARRALDDLASRFVRAANLVANAARNAVRSALFSPGATVKLDAELLAAVRERLWAQTEVDFFAALSRCAAAADIAALRDTLCATWHARLRGVAFALFDEAAPLAPESGAAAPRISRARRGLGFMLSGYGKDGQELFQHLELSAPEPRVRAKKGKSR